MLVAGTNFALLYAASSGGAPRLFARDEEFRIGLLVIGRVAARRASGC